MPRTVQLCTRKVRNTDYYFLFHWSAVYWCQIQWSNFLMKPNTFSHLSTVVWWMLQVSINTDIVDWGSFSYGLIKNHFYNEWRMSTLLNLNSFCHFPWISKIINACAIVNCILPTNLKFTMAVVLHLSNSYNKCLMCTLSLAILCYTIRDVLANDVLSETVYWVSTHFIGNDYGHHNIMWNLGSSGNLHLQKKNFCTYPIVVYTVTFQ